ncbi:MAG: type II toxin-antitoxin system prevent-host-death family antitoxin [Chloroflexota bacterium]|nr:type II toxin-antitoxin system prevent-host-death family antitoxin [Chloroflexota bacterium]
MRTASASEVTAHFEEYLEDAAEGPVVVTKGDRPVAVLIAAPEGDDLERLVLAHTPRFRHLLDEAEERVRRTGGIKHEDFWNDVFSNPIRHSLEYILTNYRRAWQEDEPFGKQHPLWEEFDALRTSLRNAEPVRKPPRDLKVSWSAGIGRWSKTPWIAFTDRRRYNSQAQSQGVAVALVFRQDMSGVYLALTQWIYPVIERYGRKAGRRILRERSAQLGRGVAPLQAAGFITDVPPDLHTEGDRGLGGDFEQAIFTHKLYERGNVPADKALLADFDQVLQVYYDAHLYSITWDTVAQDGP